MEINVSAFSRLRQDKEDKKQIDLSAMKRFIPAQQSDLPKNLRTIQEIIDDNVTDTSAQSRPRFTKPSLTWGKRNEVIYAASERTTFQKFKDSLPQSLREGLFGRGMESSLSGESKEDTGLAGFLYGGLTKTDSQKFYDRREALMSEGIEGERASEVAWNSVTGGELDLEDTERSVIRKQRLFDIGSAALDTLDFIPGLGAFIGKTGDVTKQLIKRISKTDDVAEIAEVLKKDFRFTDDEASGLSVILANVDDEAVVASKIQAVKQGEQAAEETTESLSELLRRDQSTLRPVRATGDTTKRNLVQEMTDNIKKYNAKIPDEDIVKIREQSLLNPETIDEIILRKRGVITDAEAIERAKFIRGSIDDVIALPKGTVATKEQYKAVAQIVQNEREINKSLRQMIETGSQTGGKSERDLIKSQYPDLADKSDEALLQIALEESTIKLKKAEIAEMALRSEAGRSLQALKGFVEGTDQRLRVLFNAINRNKKLTDEERTAAIEQVTKIDTSDPKAFLKAVEDLTDSDFFDKFAEWSVAAKLWNPTTHIVNLGGNAIRQILDIGIKTLTNPLAARADAAGTLQGIKNGMRSAGRALTDEGYSQQLSKFLELGGHAPAIKGTKGKIARTPFRFLAAGDEIFRNIAYQRKLYRSAYTLARKEGKRGDALQQRMQELLNAPTFKMMEDANNEAKRMTFQENMGEIVRRIDNIRDPRYFKSKGGKTFGVVARTFLPFLKTPTNLFKQSVDFTPLGLVKNFSKLKKTAKEGDTETVGTILGEAIVGSALIAFITAQTLDGNITGGAPKNKGEKDRFYREDKLPYAIKIGDRWWQYQRIDPLALVMGMTADLVNADDPNLLSLASIASANLQDKTYLSGISDLVKAFSGEEWEMEYTLKSALLGSAFPSFVGHIARSSDPIVRKADTIGQRLIAQTPGLSEELPAQYNVLGYSIERANKGLNYFFNPIQSADAGIDPVTRGLMEIDKTVSPPDDYFTRDDIRYELSEQEYADFAKFTGIKLRFGLRELFQTRKYERADDEDKQTMVDGLRTEIMNEWKDAYVEKESKKKRIKEIMLGGPSTEDKINSYFFGE